MASQQQIIAEWLLRYAEQYRDANGTPARITEATIEAYGEFLSGCDDIEALREAMRRAGRAPFFPSVSRIITEYQNIRESVQPPFCKRCEGDGYIYEGKILTRCPNCSRGAAEKKKNA